MDKIIIATKNKGKLSEFQEILKNFKMDVLSMDDAGVFVEIEESGTTFEENALIKAKTIYNEIGEMVAADDSGLEIDCLNGAPGVYTARFGGERTSYSEKIEKLLELLKEVPFEKRTARFICVIAVVLKNQQYFTVRGSLEGYIALSPKGENGFGYDPIFYVPGFDMTTAQMSSKEKHKISHRGRAISLMCDELKKRL